MISKEIEQYISAHTSPPDKTKTDLFRETHLKMIYPRMITGHYQGVLLEMISMMIRPSCILEIGTFTAYATLCLSKGLQTKGRLHTIEINPELEDFIQNQLQKEGISDQVILHTGNALEIIPQLDICPDLVYIDADKENYLNYYHLVFDKLPAGGYILADNVLWDGKVLKKEANDKETMGIKKFNQFVAEDQRVTKIMLPIRDGLYLIRKEI